jgi:hypothetical protein
MTDLDDDIRRWLELAGPRAAVPEERTARVREAVHAAWQDAVRQRVRRRRMAIGLAGLSAAAAVVLAVLLRPQVPGTPPVVTAARLVSISGSMSRADGLPLIPGDSITTGMSLQVASGGLATLALVDGGEVRLDSGTTIAFDAARALAIDRGAVYVDSGGGSTGRTAPVRVRTPVGTITDIGTRFEVRLENDEWHVRVRDGSVRFESARIRHDGYAGRELVIQPDGSVNERAVLPYGPGWRWATLAAPPFRVEGSTLAAFLAWVTAEGGRPVRFADAALERAMAGTVLHGSIEGLTTDEALTVALTTCGLAHRVEGDRILVFKP